MNTKNLTHNNGAPRPDRSRWDAHLDRKADEWIALLSDCDLEDPLALEAILQRIPPALHERVGNRGGPAIREKLYTPALRRAESVGIVEWTGQHDANGLRIWRSLIDTVTVPVPRALDGGPNA